MIGLMSRTTSPSSVAMSRSTPWVAGWCGPMLSVNSSCVSPSPAGSEEMLIDSSRRRYPSVSEAILSGPARPRATPSHFLPVGLNLVVGEQHRLAADREVAPLGVALVVLGHEDPPQVRVTVELHPEHVVDLPLGKIGAREQLDHRVDPRVFGGHARLDGNPLHPIHIQQLVQDAQPRLVRVAIDAVQAG